MAKKNSDTRGMNKKGQTVTFEGKKISFPAQSNVKPTEAVTAKGQKATGLAKSDNANRFKSQAKTRVTRMDEKPSIFSPSQVARAVSNATRGMQGASKITPPRKADVAALALGVAASKAVRVSQTIGKSAASNITAKNVAPEVVKKVIKNPINKTVNVTKSGVTGQMNNVTKVTGEVMKNPSRVAAGLRQEAVKRTVRTGVAVRNALAGSALYTAGKSAGASTQMNKGRNKKR